MEQENLTLTDYSPDDLSVQDETKLQWPQAEARISEFHLNFKCKW